MGEELFSDIVVAVNRFLYTKPLTDYTVQDKDIESGHLRTT